MHSRSILCILGTITFYICQIRMYVCMYVCRVEVRWQGLQRRASYYRKKNLSVICSNMQFFFTQNQLIITNFSSTMSSYTHQNCYLEGINEGVRPLTGGKGGVASLPNILPPLRTAPAHFL